MTQLKFRNTIHSIGVQLPANAPDGASYGAMEPERIDRNFVSTWEKITQWHHQTNSTVGRTMALTSTNNSATTVADTYNGGFNRAQMDNATFNHHRIEIDGVFNGSSQGMTYALARWLIRDTNNTLQGFNSNGSNWRGYYGVNNNSNFSSNGGGTLGIPMWNYYTNSTSNNLKNWIPKQDEPFHVTLMAANPATNNILITGWDNAYVSYNSVGFGTHGITASPGALSGGKICGFVFFGQNSYSPQFRGIISWWGMRSTPILNNINSYYGTVNQQYISSSRPSLWYQSQPSVTNFNHGGV